MNQLLKPGSSIVRTVASKVPVTIVDYLGGGGQGEVYAATLAGSQVAVKWYFPASATPEQRSALQNLIQAGPPTGAFLWPMELVEADDAQGFGYVMQLREPRYKGIVDLVRRRARPSFRSLATSCYGLADGFYHLHVNGFCYRDISFGNVFFDPANGDVLIADNDNVVVNKTAEGGVLGTPRFMAPEVVRNEAKPSTETDLFSLAVLLFYMLMISHPLEGRRESAVHALDLAAMNKLYGTDPLFIFDPNNPANEPDPDNHGNALAFWPIYPTFIRRLFTRSFTEGIRDPTHGRVQESEWRSALSRLRDLVIQCRGCGNENYYDGEVYQTSGNPGTCWSCQQALVLPPRLRVGNIVIMLAADTRLYPHHVDPARPYDFSRPVAEIARHPNDPARWGLKNLTTANWVATPATGPMRDVEPGKSIQIASGTKINFGTSEGEIRA